MHLTKALEAIDRDILDLKNSEKLYIEIVKLKKELDWTRMQVSNLIKVNHALEMRMRDAIYNNRGAICLNEENKALSQELKELKTNVARLEGLLKSPSQKESIAETVLVAGKTNPKW
jgi:predicted RNase H-like nuclease (RuvC/YqgF family)